MVVCSRLCCRIEPAARYRRSFARSHGTARHEPAAGERERSMFGWQTGKPRTTCGIACQIQAPLVQEGVPKPPVQVVRQS
jgi:hypothetical protein